jgi:hypothetical protein
MMYRLMRLLGYVSEPMHRMVTEAMEARCERAEQRFDNLLQAYQQLRVAGANPKEPDKAIPAPELPPREVMAAIRAISPRNDATFYANYRLWEENKQDAKDDPKAFAERIRRGRLNPDVEVPLPTN